MWVAASVFLTRMRSALHTIYTTEYVIDHVQPPLQIIPSFPMATINPIVEVVVNVLTSDVGKDTELESKALTPGSPNYI